jgi:NAD(P)-dependent dehydrogenase (short-subunit alcohol dehydrogenase family)
LTWIGNSGIGFETTLQLALHGARVYIAARSPDRVHKAIDDMKASHKQLLDLQPLKMDLQDLQSVKDAADSFMAKESRLDILINNAGVSSFIPPSPVEYPSFIMTKIRTDTPPRHS